MVGKVRVKIEQDDGSADEYDAVCNQVRNSTGAQCAAVIVIDGHSGSGYSVIGNLEAQILLPDILQQIVNTLRAQLGKRLQ